ncbi:MAG: hypothetical protein M2R45_03686 [Verrucomicrobia subdivision 3 bacterium]|nr:hypothetical protein [Limisphaerales bacterium]MCS1414969.1 hypothetical protein [Limisphaerales bacterium]
MKNIIIKMFVLSALFVVSQQSLQAANPISITFFGSKAIGGYDAVAYHTAKKAIAGNKKFATTWKGANWFFFSAKNLQTFLAEPTKYAPQYGGYCAWAAADNRLVKADPKIFDLHEGKLYLNYNKKTQRDWNVDRQGMITRGDRNYPKLIAK